MNIGTVVFIVLFIAADRLAANRFPRFYKRLEFPSLIIATLLLALYGCFLSYAAYEVLTSSVSAADKVWFTIFIGICVSVIAVLVVFMWGRWNKERKNDT